MHVVGTLHEGVGCRPVGDVFVSFAKLSCVLFCFCVVRGVVLRCCLVVLLLRLVLLLAVWWLWLWLGCGWVVVVDVVDVVAVATLVHPDVQLSLVVTSHACTSFFVETRFHTQVRCCCRCCWLHLQWSLDPRECCFLLLLFAIWMYFYVHLVVGCSQCKCCC